MSAPRAARRFEAALATLVATGRGREAAMYGPLRDLFVEVLGYAPGRVDIDTRGARGRPDLTVRAEGASEGALVDSEEGHAMTLPGEGLADRVRLGLALAARLDPDAEMTRGRVLALRVPADEDAARALREALAALDPLGAEAAVEAELDAIDRIVGPALGLSVEDVALVRADMGGDPFLGRVRPRHPFFTPAQRGRRTALESARRYAGIRAHASG